MANYDTWGGSWGTSWGSSWGAGSVPATSTPGRLRHVPGQYRIEDEAEKLARRIREGTIPAPVAPAIESTVPDFSAYFERSAKLAASIARIRGESAALRERIASLESREREQLRAKERAKIEKLLTLALQAQQLARIQEALLLEEIEAVDVAFLAVTVLTVILH